MEKIIIEKKVCIHEINFKRNQEKFFFHQRCSFFSKALRDSVKWLGFWTPRKYVFWDAIQYFTGQRYTLTKLQNAGNFKFFSHRVLPTAKKAQNLEPTL